MRRRTAGIRLALLIGLTAACAPDGAEWTAGTLTVSVDGTGHVVGLVDESTGVDYRADGVPAPLLSIQTAGVLHAPTAFSWDANANIAWLSYPNGEKAHIGVWEYETHLHLNLTGLDSDIPVDLVVWGPYATTISETIGETVGVVRDSSVAIGIPSLNPNTLGGLAWRDNDFPPQVDLFESGDILGLKSYDRTDEGVIFISRNANMTIRWAAVIAVEETPHHLFPLTDRCAGVACTDFVPNRAADRAFTHPVRPPRSKRKTCAGVARTPKQGEGTSWHA